MQGKLASLLIALLLIITPLYSQAAKKHPPKPVKILNLQLQNPKLEPVSTDKINFEFDEPSAGEIKLIEQMKLRPEFYYVQEDDDYNSKNNKYDHQIKLWLNLNF